jgi:hypothetical protein
MSSPSERMQKRELGREICPPSSSLHAHEGAARGQFDVCEGSGYTVTSTCSSSSIQMTSDGAVLGGASCFFVVNYPMCDGAERTGPIALWRSHLQAETKRQAVKDSQKCGKL